MTDKAYQPPNSFDDESTSVIDPMPDHSRQMMLWPLAMALNLFIPLMFAMNVTNKQGIL